MAVKCMASGCPHTTASGKSFAHCDKCGATFCSDHGHRGGKCPMNCGGILR
jgi:hypothetical protein